MSIGKNIKNARKNKDITLEELANKIGLTRQTISRYETGKISNIPSDKIEGIALALDVTPAYLMGWEEVENKSVELNPKEQNHINKYRSLDSYGQKNVDTILDNEYDRCNAQPSFIPAENIDMAASGGYGIVSDKERSRIADEVEKDEFYKDK